MRRAPKLAARSRPRRRLLLLAPLLAACTPETDVAAGAASNDTAALVSPVPSLRPLGGEPMALRHRILGDAAPAVAAHLPRMLAALRAGYERAPSVSLATHYLLLRPLLVSADPNVEAARALLTGRSPKVAPLVRSRSGVRFAEHGHKEHAAPSQESHVAQALAGLAEAGHGRDAEVCVDGRNGTLGEVLTDLVENYYPGRHDIEWTAHALIHFLPPQRTWRNRYGETGSFDELAEELLRRCDRNQSCGGLHVATALLHLHDANRRHAVLDPQLGDRVRARVDEIARRLAATQRPDGSWTLGWRAPGRATGRQPPGTELLATGHALEFLARLPDDLRPHARTMEAACRWCWLQLEDVVARHDAVPPAIYCAFTHAFRSVCVVLQANPEVKEANR